MLETEYTMADFNDQPPLPHTYLVAGGGGGMRSTIILRMIAGELTERKMPFTVIEGITGNGEDQAVHTPSMQSLDMESSIAEHPEDTPLLFIAHCIGTVAGLHTLERVESRRPAALVSVAPPLPSPRHTIMTPPSVKKRSEGDTLMRVVDLPPGAMDYSAMTESQARISPLYFKDIDAADNLEQRLRAKVESGKAAVHAPEHDWNVESPSTIKRWHAEWVESLSADDAAAMQQRARLVYDAAHGLYLSPRGSIEITPEADIQFQARNVSNLVDAGLDLLHAQQ